MLASCILAPILGLLFAHGVELQHQAIHYIGVKSKTYDSILGVLLGLPTLNSFFAYQATHLLHHRNVGRADDKEFFDHRVEDLNPIQFISRALSPLRALKGLALKLTGGNQKNANFSERTFKKASLEVSVYRMLLLILILNSLISNAGKNVLVLWLLSYWSYSTIHLIIEFPEHFGCERLNQDICKNTRSITAGRIASYLTNYNNLHVEHHLYPGIPMHKLPQIHKSLATKIKYREDSYARFYLRFLTGSK
jgi:fatty acid desaturase